jgi:hypothetical protein
MAFFLKPFEISANEIIKDCDQTCLKNFSEYLKNKYDNNIYSYIYTPEATIVQNDFPPEFIIESQVIRDLIENIYIIENLNQKKISLYENIRKYIKNKGVVTNIKIPISLNSILTNSLPITHNPIFSSTDLIIFNKNIEIEAPLFPAYYPSKSNLALKKIALESILNSSLIKELNLFSTKFFYQTHLSVTSNPYYISIPSNEIEQLFNFNHESTEVEYLLHKILYESILQKNHSIGENFPGMGYGFSEYITENSKGFLSIISEDSTNEFLYIIPSENIFFYFYTESSSYSKLLNIINEFNKKFYPQSFIESTSTNDLSDYSGTYMPVNIPDNNIYYIIHLLYPTKIETKEDGIILLTTDNKNSIFFTLKNNIFINKDNSGVRLDFILNEYGDTKGFHLSNGFLNSFRKVNNAEYDKFIFKLSIFIIYFSIIIVLYLSRNFLKNEIHFHLGFFQFFSSIPNLTLPIQKLKKMIFFISFFLLIYIFLLSILLIKFTWITDKLFIKLDLIISYTSIYPILIFVYFCYFIYKFISLYQLNELNLSRIIKYFLFITLVLYFYLLLYLYGFINFLRV